MSNPSIYTITDMGPHDDWEGCWWASIWAESSIDALRFAQKIYSGEWPDSEIQLRVTRTDSHPDAPQIVPVQEQRPEVLRDLGWRYDDEEECERCGLSAFAIDAHEVGEDGLCGECRQREEEEVE